LIIFGWLRRFTTLGVKPDECATCNRVCDHVVGRKTWWFSLFWFPVLLFKWEHGMACSNCGAWTGIPWRAVRSAMKTGVLHLERPRPGALAALSEMAAADNAPPPQLATTFDRFTVNPKRGLFDFYTKAWPVAVVAFFVLVGISVALNPRPTGPEAVSEGAHECWEAADGSVNGCRMASGEIVGTSIGTPVTCYFDEAKVESQETISCDR
jgi:hypothetical protein